MEKALVFGAGAFYRGIRNAILTKYEIGNYSFELVIKKK